MDLWDGQFILSFNLKLASLVQLHHLFLPRYVNWELVCLSWGVIMGQLEDLDTPTLKSCLAYFLDTFSMNTLHMKQFALWWPLGCSSWSRRVSTLLEVRQMAGFLRLPTSGGYIWWHTLVLNFRIGYDKFNSSRLSSLYIEESLQMFKILLTCWSDKTLSFARSSPQLER